MDTSHVLAHRPRRGGRMRWRRRQATRGASNLCNIIVSCTFDSDVQGVWCRFESRTAPGAREEQCLEYAGPMLISRWPDRRFVCTRHVVSQWLWASPSWEWDTTHTTCPACKQTRSAREVMMSRFATHANYNTPTIPPDRMRNKEPERADEGYLTAPSKQDAINSRPSPGVSSSSAV